MIKKICLIFAFLILLCGPGCGEKNLPPEGEINISGATTLSPFVEAAVFEFKKICPGIKVRVIPAGTMIGLRQLRAGSTEIVLTDIYQPLDDNSYEAFKFGRFPVAIVGGTGSGVEDLGQDQLIELFGEKFHNWKQLGGHKLEIKLLSQGPFSGLRLFFNQNVLKNRPLPESVEELSSNQEVLSIAASERGTVGYAVLPSVRSKVPVFKLDGQPPFLKEAFNPDYPLSSEAFLILEKNAPKHVNAFKLFLSSPLALPLYREYGISPINQNSFSASDIRNSLNGTPAGGVKTFEICGMLLAGLGLFLSGVKLVSAGLRSLSGRRIRKIVSKWTSNRFSGAFIGTLCGAVIQSSTSGMFIMMPLVSMEAITMRSALFLVSWMEIGTTLIVFLAALNIKVFILYFLALTGITFSQDRKNRKPELLRSLLGLALLLYGFAMVKSSAMEMSQLPGVHDVIEFCSSSYIMPFIAGVLLRAFTQSSSAVAILAIPLLMSGVFSFEQCMMMIFGTAMGSASTDLILSSGVKGIPKQMVYYKAASDITISLFLPLLMFVEMKTGIPLLRKLLERLGPDENTQIALVFLTVKILPVVTIPLSYKFLRKAVDSFSPPTKEENLSKPKFINDSFLEGPDSAIPLVAAESSRIVGRLPYYLEYIRKERREPSYSADSIHRSAADLDREIKSFSTELFRQSMSKETTLKLLSVEKRHGLALALDDTVFEFLAAARKLRGNERTSSLLSNIVEGLHAILLTARDAAKTGDQSDVELLFDMTRDRRGLVENMRLLYADSHENENASLFADVYRFTDLYQRTVWLLNRWAVSMRSLSDE